MPTSTGPEDDLLITLVVIGPGEGDPSTEQYPPSIPVSAILGKYNFPGSLIEVSAYRAPDRQGRLPSDARLGDLGFKNGDTFYIEIDAITASAGPDILYYIANTLASGIIGNAAYDQLRRAVTAVAQRWGRRNSERNPGATLSRSDAESIAKLAIGARFELDSPELLVVVDGQEERVTVDGQQVDAWQLTIKQTAGTGDTEPGGMRIPAGVLMDAQVFGPDPREVRVVFRAA